MADDDVTTDVDPEAAEAAGAVSDVDNAELVRKWRNELNQAQKRFKDYHVDAERSVRRYLDENLGAQDQFVAPKRLNIFHSNVDTIRSNLLAQIPKVEADRRFFDPGDDVARVAAEIMARALNNDLNNPNDQGMEALRAGLQDKLIAGLGVIRFRYVMEEGPDPAMTAEAIAELYPDGIPEDYEVPTVKIFEACEPVYTYWKDVLWGSCRMWGPPWMAYRAYMTKEAVAKRFGKDTAKLIPYGRDGSDSGSISLITEFDDTKRTVPEAEVWEIWDKDTKRVYWYVEGYQKFLDVKDDLFEVSGFFPSPRPLIANTTSSKFLPKPDYTIHRGLYEEIDELETRISYLTRAAKAVGVYDASNPAIKRVMSESVENELIPVDNWALFAERGGMKGAIDWVPIDAIVGALQTCVQQQQLRIEQLYQVTGISDIIRGQSSGAATATEQKIKAEFASTRLQFMQDEFAEYVSDLMNIKVGIMRNLYSPEALVKLSNIMATPDAPLVEQAMQLIGNKDDFDIRVIVRAESLMQKNIEAIKGERTEMLQGIAQFMGMAQPMIQMSPQAAPFLFQLLQFGVSGFQGAKEMEGLFDQYVQQLQMQLQQEMQQPPQPSPEQQKMQAQMQLEQAKLQAQMQAKQAEMQAQTQAKQAEMQMAMEAKQAEMALDQQKAQSDLQMRQAEAQAELQMAQEKHALEIRKLESELVFKEREFELRLAELQAKLNFESQRAVAQQEADAMKLETQQVTAAMKLQQQQASGDMKLDQQARQAQQAQQQSKQKGSKK